MWFAGAMNHPASGLAAVIVRGPAIGGGGAGRRAEEDFGKVATRGGWSRHAASFGSRGPVAKPLSCAVEGLVHLRQALGRVVSTFFF